MSKTTKSQWDFGELFPGEATRQVLSVTQLTSQLRRLLEKQFGTIWVTGEITNLRLQSSGHVYFTLKDAGAQLSCVLFRGDALSTRESLADGRKVILKGEMTVYETRGQYQLRVLAIELQGVGGLQAAFEKLKQKLNAEGLFAPERKRLLPRFPARIGLITSPAGAALRDVLHVVRRRNPALEIIFAPCCVQGQSAGLEIATAIRLLNEWGRLSESARKLDLILLTRGGGSLEDLWAFNEEIVARAIFDSGIPVVSAIGHEIDFTISDFVADVRAATPSAAAEIITEGVFSSCKFISEIAERIQQRARQHLRRRQEYLRQVGQRHSRVHPRRRLNEKLQLLDELRFNLSSSLHQAAIQRQAAWQALRDRMSRVRPAQCLARRRDHLRQERRLLDEHFRHRLRHWRERLNALKARLRILSPEQVLARGYSITADAVTGKVIRSAKETAAGRELKTRLGSGEVRSIVVK